MFVPLVAVTGNGWKHEYQHHPLPIRRRSKASAHTLSPKKPSLPASSASRSQPGICAWWHWSVSQACSMPSTLLTIAFVVPLLAGEWDISSSAIGLLISTGYIGQLIGAVALTALAERIGRLSALRLAVGILGTLSIACAFASSYPILLALRFFQGVGLGGEVPIAAKYQRGLPGALPRPARIPARAHIRHRRHDHVTDGDVAYPAVRLAIDVPRRRRAGTARDLVRPHRARILCVGSRATTGCVRPTKSCRRLSGRSRATDDADCPRCRRFLLFRMLHQPPGGRCSQKATLGVRSPHGQSCSSRRLPAMA